nr:choice-of-anchor Q domain-containing protein [Kofleriaceae bacterium]
MVANGSDNATCDQAAPCATLSAALATTKQLISIDGAIGSITDAVSINRSATIYGVHGGTLTASGSDDVLTLDSGASTVAAFDLDISGGAANGVSLTNGTLSLMRATVSNNAGVGISQTGGTLHLSRSTVASNHNGIHVDGGTFDITNNFIVLNGNGSDSLYGGMWIDDASAGSRFEFNTVVDNQIPGGAGFRSAGLLVTPVGLSSPNNILVHNAIGTDTLLANANYVSQGGSNAPLCSVGSDEGPLMFVGGGDYHITTGSVAIDHATPTPDLNTDADGNERPVGSAADQGAQEVQSD